MTAVDLVVELSGVSDRIFYLSPGNVLTFVNIESVKAHPNKRTSDVSVSVFI